MYIPNGIPRRYFFPGEEDAVLPGFVGGFNADKLKNDKRILNKPGIYPLEFTSTMRPLEKHKEDITMVTGLDRSFKHGQDAHAQGASCYLTSVSPEQAAEKGMRHPNGRSLDHVIGDKVGHTSVYNTLEISCNGFTAGKEDIFFDNISWYGPGKIAPSIKNPRKLYDRLFMADSYRNHVQDVTDLILADTKSLSRKLGNEDKDTLDGFVTMIREIELRIEKLEKMIKGADANQPTNEILPRGEYIRLQADLMLAALQMGITNASTFMIGPERWDASLMYEGVFPKPVQHHNMTHNQKKEEVAKELQKIDIFHLEQFSYVHFPDEGDQGVGRDEPFPQFSGHLWGGLGRRSHPPIFRPAHDRGRQRARTDQAGPLHQVQERHPELKPLAHLGQPDGLGNRQLCRRQRRNFGFVDLVHA